MSAVPQATPAAEAPRARRLRAVGRYGFAVAITSLAIAVQEVVVARSPDRLDLEPLLLPIVLSAFFGGLGPGLVALAVAAAGAAFLTWSPSGLSAPPVVEWAGLLGGGALILLLLERMRLASESAVQAERRYAAIIASAMDGIVTLDEGQRVTSFNAAAERMFGWSAAEVIGGPLDRLLPEGMAEEHRRLVREFARSGGTRRLGASGTIFGRRASGEAFPIELSILQADVGGRKVFAATLRDLTQSLRDEAVRRETDRKLRLFIENAPAAIAMVDREMRYLFASRRWVTDYRIDCPDIIGRSHYQIFPEISEHWKLIHRRCLAGAVERGEEEVFPRQDGSCDWVSWEVRPWYDAAGDVGGLILMSEVVTQQKLAVDALRESEERWRTLVELLPDPLFVSQGGRIVYMNQRGLELWRAERPEQLLGRGPADLLHPDDRAALATQIETAADGVPTALWEARIVALDGTIVPVESTANIRHRDGQRFAQVVVRDISARKRVEEQLRFQEGVLRETGRIAKVGGFSLDVASGASFWTEETACVHDCDPAAPAPRRLGIDLYRGASRARLEAALTTAIADGRSWDVELELVTPKGNHKWVRTIGHPVVENGGVVRVQGSLQDVTAQREVAEQIRRLNAELELRVRDRTAELEAANDELEAFSYSVSHDLRAPLRTMDGFAEIVQTDFGSQIPLEAARCIRVIRDSAQRMGRLIDDLLKFSQLGREALHPARVDMRALVDETLGELRPGCGDRVVDVDVGALDPCRGDRALLKQVWTNLLSNALKYTRRQPAARIAVGCTHDAAGNPSYFVRDNGTGFDMRYADKLFGVFQRLHRVTEFEGTGVGLAIVQRIVQRHGGRVWCDAAEGRGATFFFTVGPAARAAVTEAAQ